MSKAVNLKLIGVGNPTWLAEYIYDSYYTFNKQQFPSGLVFDFKAIPTSNQRRLQGTFAECVIGEVGSGETSNIKLKCKKGVKCLQGLFEDFKCNQIDLTEFDTSEVTVWSSFLAGSTLPQGAGYIEILGDLDFSATTSNLEQNVFGYSSSIKELRIKKNTLSVSINFGGNNANQNLSDDTLISVANGINNLVIGKNIALPSNPKAHLSTIMGNNINGEFIKNEQGTMTLQDFITNVKGWTIA